MSLITPESVWVLQEALHAKAKREPTCRFHSLYDKIGLYDVTLDTTYYEHGINLLHGFLTERYVDDPEYIVQVPAGLESAEARVPARLADQSIVWPIVSKVP